MSDTIDLARIRKAIFEHICLPDFHTADQLNAAGTELLASVGMTWDDIIGPKAERAVREYVDQKQAEAKAHVEQLLNDPPAVTDNTKGQQI
jgi:hypothetical protein